MADLKYIGKNILNHDLILKKGDVVVWDSRLIHGASKIKNKSFSRKSLTAHYLSLIHI